MMNRNDLNTDVRTQINPEDEEKTAKSGYTQVKDLMNTGNHCGFTANLNYIFD